MTVESIDRSDPECWRCELTRHKTAYKGKRRTLFFGVRCQAVLTRWIVKAGSGKGFSRSHSMDYSPRLREPAKRQNVEQFGPNAIRHRVGTEARKQFGLDGLSNVLGHANALTRLKSMRN